MNHSGADDLHPPCAFAARTARAVTQLALDVHLGRRLREREKARTETCLRFAEQPVREMSECRFQIDERHPLVDGEAFDLREHRRVRCIEEVATIAVAGTENPDRWLVRLHRDRKSTRLNSSH